MQPAARPSWDEYFIDLAKMASSRSTCFRNRVGAVIVRDRAIISTGYNGAPRHQPNCAEIGYCYRDKHNIPSGTQLEKCRAVGSHAETNAISLAAKNGNSTNDATIYIWGHKMICHMCKAAIANCGILRAVLHNGSGIEEYYPSNDWVKHPIDQ